MLNERRPTARLRVPLAGRRAFRGNLRGVSEILGTIMILSLTVVLFSAIFYFVSTLPTPPNQANSQFNAALGVSAGGTEAFVNISYVAGPLLTDAATEIFLSSSIHPNTFSCARFGNYGDPYTLSQGLGGASTWSAGTTWSLPLQVGTTTCPGGSLSAQGDNVTLSIINIAQNTLLLHVTLPGASPTVAPLFISEATTPATPVVDTTFNVTAVIRSTSLKGDSVYASLNSLGISTPIQLTLRSGPATAAPVAGTNEWSAQVSSALIPPTVTLFPGQPYNLVLNATDTLGQGNSVVLPVTFATPAASADLQVSLTLSDGSPRVNENVTVSAEISNTGGGAASGLTVTFRSSVTGALGTTIHVATTLGAGVTLTPPPQTFWRATGAAGGHIGAGAVTLWVWVNGTSGTTALATYANLGVTVFPRTLLIDETGVAPGVNGSEDTFTYVATDFNSADIPFNTTTIPPGSSIVTWLGSGPDALDNYDVIVWVLSNSNGFLSASDAAALQLAVTQGDRSVWLLGSNALAGTSSAVTALQPYFGISHLNAQTFTSPVNLAVSQSTPISTTNVNNGNLYLSPVLDGYMSHTTYQSIVPVSSSDIFIQEGRSPTQLPVATYNVPGGKALASPFELATVSQEMPNGTSQYVTSLGQQSALVYGIFNWLSNFSSLTPVRQASDWAVSQVSVQPTNIAYNTPIYVNYTVRNNGPSRHAIPVALYVNGAEAYVAGSPVTNTVSPTTLGGVTNGTFIWTPTFVGFLTVTVVISPPSTDADLSNNQMGNSLFAEQLYVHYNVLLVDATAGAGHDTTPLVYTALNATGYPAGTVTEVRLPAACAGLPSTVSLSLYNLVIWNAGNKQNATGHGPCVLTSFDVTELSSYLDDGGKAASLLFIGGGLLTETNPTVVAFAEDFLGAIVPSTPAQAFLPAAPSGVLYGANGDPVGDGLAIPYGPVGTGNNFTYSAVTTVNLNAQPSLYYNQKDYWTLNTPPQIAASDGYSVSGGWTTSFWAFNLATAGDSQQLELLMLRDSTFFGRILPTPDVVVSPPETTFATSSAPWQSFDQLHPQIDEQNLIRVNVTNLGGVAAFSVGVDVLDGSHILEATSVTVAPAALETGVGVVPGVGQISIPWVPIYAGENNITVELVSGLVGETLPAAGSVSSWAVTVYFFYDSSQTNGNSWTHSQEILEETNAPSTPNAGSCYQQPGGNAALWGAIDIPQEWSLAQKAGGTACTYSSTYGNDKWGMDVGTCFITSPYCASLAIGDGTSKLNTVTWAYTANFTIPAGTNSAIVDWWQEFNLATSQSGGIVCVQQQSAGPLPSGSGTNPAVLSAVFNTCQAELPPSPIYNSPAAPSLYNGAGTCYELSSFSGASLGGSGQWQEEKLNVTSFAGETVYVAFGFVEGTNACSTGTLPSPATGWNIDDLSVSVAGNTNPAPVSSDYSSCPSAGGNIPGDLWTIVPNSELTQTLSALDNPGPAPTGSAWVAGAWSSGVGSILTLDPNMWDSLYSRSIDLTGALNATLNFNYLWSDVWWVDNNPYFPPYDYPMAPQQDFLLQVAPAVTTSATPWTTVWSANLWSGNEYNGADAQFLGYVEGGHTIYPNNDNVAVFRMGWHAVSVSLNAYIGDTIRLRFIVGTNCGGNTADGYAYFNYPEMNAGNPSQALPTVAMLSGVNITGVTVIPPGSPPASPPTGLGKLTSEARASGALGNGGSSELPGLALSGSSPLMEVRRAPVLCPTSPDASEVSGRVVHRSLSNERPRLSGD